MSVASNRVRVENALVHIRAKAILGEAGEADLERAGVLFELWQRGDIDRWQLGSALADILEEWWV